MTAICPIKLKGNWDVGYALNLHSISSTYCGEDEFGNNQFDTKRTNWGELIYKLKYQHDLSVIPEVVEAVITFINRFHYKFDLIIPVPSSRFRSLHPVFEIAKNVGARLNKSVEYNVLRKIRRTPEQKDVEQKIPLTDSFSVVGTIINDKSILLLDDLYQSGNTLNSICHVLREMGHVKAINVITITKTRKSQ